MNTIRPLPCRICGANIYFDDRKAASGKPIPIDFRTKEPHNCNLEVIHQFRSEVALLKDRIADLETLLSSIHVKERLEDIEKRLEKLEGAE